MLFVLGSSDLSRNDNKNIVSEMLLCHFRIKWRPVYVSMQWVTFSNSQEGLHSMLFLHTLCKVLICLFFQQTSIEEATLKQAWKHKDETQHSHDSMQLTILQSTLFLSCTQGWALC